MKVSFLFLVFAILAISCKKNDDPAPAPHENTFSASVDGTAFVPTSIEVAVSGSSPGTRAIHVYANDVNGHQLFLYMYEYDGTKSTFNLDQSGSSAGSFCTEYCSSISATLSASNSGEIKIASFDKTTYTNGEVITGTFQFQTDDNVGKYSITNGHFSVFVPPN